MCDEIREELVRVNYLEKYRIAQIREKYGILRRYDFGRCSHIPHRAYIFDNRRAQEVVKVKTKKMKRVVLYWQNPLHDYEEELPFRCLANKDDEWIKGMFMELLGIEYDPDICRWDVTDYYEKEVSV